METRQSKKGLKYREQVYIHGQKLKSPWFRRKTDAKNWKAKKLAERDKYKSTGEIVNRKMTETFSSYAHEWIEFKKRPFLSESTYVGYKKNLEKYIIPFIGHLKLNQVDDSHGHQIIAYLKKTNHNGKGINIIMDVAKGAFRDAVKEGILFRSPFLNLPRMKEDLREDAFWTKAEINQFLRSNVHHPLYEVFFTALHTGARKGEILGLCWDRVDFVSNLITITRTYGRTGLKETTKTNTRRVVPIFSELRKLLERLRREQRNPKFVFTDPDGNPFGTNHIYRHFRRAQEEAGMERFIRFHDLRHVFASQYMENGGNIFELQKILGHTDPKMTTRRYAHFSPSHMQNTLQFMDLGARYEEELHPKRPQENKGEGKISLISGS